MEIIKKEVFPIETEKKKMRHASSLLALPDGSIMGAYFAGTYEGEADTDIYVTIRNPEGRWSPSRKISTEENIAHWNPVLALDSKGRISLFYKVGFAISKWKTMLRRSYDYGLSWTPSQELVPGDEGGRGPVRNKILITKEKIWIAGASIERETSWTAFADRSLDEGNTWIRSNTLSINDKNAHHELYCSQASSNFSKSTIAVTSQSFKGRGIIQPTLWEDSQHRIHMLLRSTEGVAYRSDSEDQGLSWSPPYPTSIPNNNAALDIVSLDDDTLVLAHNPVKENWGKRTPLVISVSKDNGFTWEQALVLEDGSGEYSYPAIICKENTIYVSYTWNRNAIVFAQIVYP
jgi:predicted neuraminidase